MYKLRNLLGAVGTAVVLSSCAGTYHQIHPQSLSYGFAPKSNARVQVGYHYNVLTEKRNKKFARKEEKKNLHLAAVKLTNNTTRPLVFGQDMQLTSGGMVVTPANQMLTYKNLKQQAPLFLLFLLLSPMQLTVGHSTTNQYGSASAEEPDTFPIGLIIGPGIALGNMLVANGNNKRFQDELTACDLTNRTIAPGETVYGLIGLSQIPTAPLEMRIISSEPQEETSDDYFKE